jgi:tetratricopeptide (TPR) repeat protein
LSVKSESLYKNKIRLVFEYNRKSPLFAHIANWELENNNLDIAIEILEEGLREFPDFPTPYFVLGKAYSRMDKYSKALKCFKKGSELIGSNKSYEFYLGELESLRRFKTPIEMRGMDILKSTENKKEESSGEEEEKSPAFEDHLDEIAEKISHAKIPVVPGETEQVNFEKENFYSNSIIVSETLAKIYLAQGELQAAIAVYEKLIRKNPEKEGYFSQKISELKTKLP